MQKLSIIDTIGPFFLKTSGDTINWSKVPFSELEKGGQLPFSTQKEIASRFESYLKKVGVLGYNSISVDDLAHMALLPFYSPELRQLLDDYRQLYKKLFSIAKKQGMEIYANTDYLFFNSEIEAHLEATGMKPADFFLLVLESTFTDFPEINGVILRIGENDGKDVAGQFLSKLALKTPQEVAALLQKILPFFGKNNKTLIFRTWTVGVYEIGDLIWNKATFDAAFSAIKSNALILSMKFGDTDFMRYLHLNPLFLHGPHKKIIELQTRREWEGMGELLSFVGWDYENYFRTLEKNTSIVGMHVWCQTGGWAGWNNLTYLENGSLWNELNTELAISLHQGKTTKDAIEAFCREHGIKNVADFTRLLELSEITVKKGLYISELATLQLYFRRTRIPTLIWTEWDKIPLQPMVISLLRSLIQNPKKTLVEADAASAAADEMLELGKNLRLNAKEIESLKFQQATLRLFAQLRRYIFTDITPEEVRLLNDKIVIYQKTYPQHYEIGMLKARKFKKIPRRLLASVLREGVVYRKRDKLLLATSPLQQWLVRYYLRRSGSHLANQSMGIESLFK